MRTIGWFDRGLRLLVTVAVGVSFVGRPLMMKGGVLAAQQAARQEASAMPDMAMAGHAGSPMPCHHHCGQCCAPCLACCACAVVAPLPPAAGPLGPVIAAARVVRPEQVASHPVRPGRRHLQPLPLGPPLPLVS